MEPAAVNAAVDAALVEAAREAVSRPNVRSAINAAARESVQGASGLSALSGIFGQPTPVSKAVDAALVEAAREAVPRPNVRSAINAAARESVQGASGLSALSGIFGQPTPVSKAVDAALVEAAREAGRVQMCVPRSTRRRARAFRVRAG